MSCTIPPPVPPENQKPPPGVKPRSPQSVSPFSQYTSDLPAGAEDHYGGRDNVYEAIKVIRAWGLGFELGNALKYLCRAGKKDPSAHLQDLEKAAWYVQAEIAKLKGSTRANPS